MASTMMKFVMFGDDEAPPWYQTGSVPKANCIGAWLPVSALTLAASYINLVTPGTHDLIAGTTAPTLDGGWVAGSGAYLVSDITELNTWTTIIKYSGVVGSAGFEALYGSYKTAGTVIRSPYNSASGTHTYRNGTAASEIAGSLTAGVLAIAGAKAYIDGVEDATIVELDNTGLPFYVMGLNNDGSLLFNLVQGKILALATYNITLTQAQIQAIGAALP